MQVRQQLQGRLALLPEVRREALAAAACLEGVLQLRQRLPGRFPLLSKVRKEAAGEQRRKGRRRRSRAYQSEAALAGAAALACLLAG